MCALSAWILKCFRLIHHSIQRYESEIYVTEMLNFSTNDLNNFKFMQKTTTFLLFCTRFLGAQRSVGRCFFIMSILFFVVSLLPFLFDSFVSLFSCVDKVCHTIYVPANVWQTWNKINRICCMEIFWRKKMSADKFMNTVERLIKTNGLKTNSQMLLFPRFVPHILAIDRFAFKW